MNVVYGANRQGRRQHDEACRYTWSKGADVEPWECGSCSDAEWWRDNMIASVQAQWNAHAMDHMDSEACTICRYFDSVICRMQRKPFAPVGVLQAAWGAEPYTPVGVENVSIPFTRDEWLCIKGSLELTIHDRCIGNEGEMELNIIDRIEKNLGIE